MAPPPEQPAEPEPWHIDPTMLDADEPDELDEPTFSPRATPSPPSPRELSPEQMQAAMRAAYAQRYRPPSNPVRLNVTARGVFTALSGRDGVNGRLGGVGVDLGLARNHFGAALTLRGLAGRVQLDPQTALTAMVGGGPTLGVGRLALLGRGYVDTRVGYDLFYAPSPGGTARAPHGPRLRLDLGLLLEGERRRTHGVGFSVGYQRLVGSAHGPMPPANVMSIGVAYWLG